ncbi:MAG TPA: cytochrome d ubiquinol oxidase subunit II [Candidatus Acidoferrales bacterium]|nr:cytochrome d ubiquinol oxidase subunit II [Candidatus Acidoferrales bacterium]
MAYELLYYLNYGILAAFLSMFAVELGMAIRAMCGYSVLKERIRHYVMPLWEITGTFAVFYIVDLVATYPNLVPVIAPIYIGPIIAAALLLILRNAFLAYGEIMGGHAKEKQVFAIYSATTIIIAFILSAILGSVVSGSGVDVASGSLNVAAMLFNGFGLAVFLAMVLIGLFAASVLIGDKKERAMPAASAFVALVLMLSALGFGTAYGAGLIASNEYLVILYAVFIAVVVPLYLAGRAAAKKLVFPLVFFGVLCFAVIQNQMLFNGAASFASYVTNTAGAQYLIIATVGGGAFLVAALSYFIYLTFMKRATS